MNLKLKSWLLIVSTLLLGFVLGVLTVRCVYRTHHGEGRCQSSHGWRSHHPGIFGSHRDKGFLLKKMEKHLDLTEDQKLKITPIIELYHNRFETRMKESRQAFKKEMEAFHGELRPFLTEEQNRKLDKMKQRMEKRHGHRQGHQSSDS